MTLSRNISFNDFHIELIRFTIREKNFDDRAWTAAVRVLLDELLDLRRQNSVLGIALLDAQKGNL